MNKKDMIRQILISCGISVMISTTTSIVLDQLFIKKFNKSFEAINDDIEELKEQYESLNIKLKALENQDDFLLLHENKNYLKYCLDQIKYFLQKEKLKLNIDINEVMEDEIRSAYSLNKSDYLKGGEFIIALAILDCKIYGENKKYVLSTFRRNDNYEILRGINNPDILIFGINVNGECEYTSLANDNLIINSIDTGVEKYFPYVERIPNEEPTVTYEEIKVLEAELNNSNKLTRK